MHKILIVIPPSSTFPWVWLWSLYQSLIDSFHTSLTKPNKQRHRTETNRLRVKAALIYLDDHRATENITNVKYWQDEEH